MMEKSRHKNKTFEMEREFENWLKENTKYKIRVATGKPSVFGCY